MIESVTQAIGALQAETATYPQGVQVWMRVMGLSFLASILFVFKRVGARYVLAALVLNILGLVAGKLVFPEASRTVIGTYVHILFWPAMLWGVWRSSRGVSFSRDALRVIDRVYWVWLGWACLLISVSLVLDVRTLFSL